MCNQIKVAVYEDVFLPCNFNKSVFNLGGWLNVDKITEKKSVFVLFRHSFL